MTTIDPLQLDATTLHQRAQRLRLVVADNDGTLTDGTSWYGPDGEAYKRYSLRDGMGVELLRLAGVETAILTREASEITLRRAEKLNIEHCFRGIRDKRAFLPELLAVTGQSIEAVAYIGDDVNDLAIIQAIAPHGLTGAPCDAHPDVLASVHFRSPQPGGAGAFRAFVEWLLRCQKSGVHA